MAEIRVECTNCSAHFLVEEEVFSDGLTCPKCEATEFRRLPDREQGSMDADEAETYPAEGESTAGSTEQKQAETQPKKKAPAAATVPEREGKSASTATKAKGRRKSDKGADVESIQEISRIYDQITGELGKVIVGQHHVVEELMVAILSGGHCLLEGVPGLAKTLLISSLAQSMKLSFKRIQFTPDLMPSDITGTEIIQEDPVTRERKFHFLKGPVFANVILADEINRTPPKTQSALLEAMQEKQVSIGGEVYPLEMPFFILATQNPLEQEGTYPLPEAQQDRFFFKLLVDYPQMDEEHEIVRRVAHQDFGDIAPVCDGPSLLKLQKSLVDMPVADAVIEYANRLTRATRITGEGESEFVRTHLAWGAGPRAPINLVIAAKCFAALAGSPAPSCDDVERAALPVLRHRIALNYTGRAEGLTTDDVIKRLLGEVEKY